MSGVNPRIIAHWLGIRLSFCPVKQKKQSFALEGAKTIKAEVEKLMSTQYIWEVDYPEWLANVVLVPKGEGK